jgi:hypothetical protein
MGTIYKSNGEIIEDVSIESLEEQQKYVGGYIEYVYMGDSVLIVNEEGRILGLPINKFITSLYGSPIFGDVIMTKIEEIYEK